MRAVNRIQCYPIGRTKWNASQQALHRVRREYNAGDGEMLHVTVVSPAHGLPRYLRDDWRLRPNATRYPVPTEGTTPDNVRSHAVVARTLPGIPGATANAPNAADVDPAALNRQPCPTLLPSPRQNLASVGCRHPCAEPVFALTFLV